MTTKSPTPETPTRQTQMSLLVDPAPWRIDEETREIGRKGLAQARAALEASRRRSIDDLAA